MKQKSLPVRRSAIKPKSLKTRDIRPETATVAIVGLGYVGLPLAVAFAKTGFSVAGFDVKPSRVEELRQGKDSTDEVDPAELKQKRLNYTSDEKMLAADFVIVAVPTPVHENKDPDLLPLKSASQAIGRNLKPGSIVVYESTVWPGLTEEYCVPIIEKASGKKCGKDFFVGYSPERINPGDKEHTLLKMIKVVSGMDQKTLDRIAWLYGAICKEGGVYKAPSIRVAEAAKVIENTQRDLNISLMNELAMIFKKLGINTKDVLATASTKWNFGRYTPGMVGGHCIPVDPYYLTTLAQKVGYEPRVILAGRAINDSMPAYVADLYEEGLREIGLANKKSKKSRVLVLGLTFKENVPDTRTSPARDLIRILEKRGHQVYAFDPLVALEEAKRHFGGDILPSWPDYMQFDGIIITVTHREFSAMPEKAYKKLFADGKGVLVDVRGIFAQRPNNGIVYKTL
jgi:UDP-N-acetyl-D-glucosamine/UDP-N-acetyl-D-galactosamine dehydrogenase